jgi:hypothetical protein
MSILRHSTPQTQRVIINDDDSIVGWWKLASTTRATARQIGKTRVLQFFQTIFQTMLLLYFNVTKQQQVAGLCEKSATGLS